MSRGVRSSGPKRKRNWSLECSFFMREQPPQFREASLRTVETAASLSEDWLRCGEGFQDTSGTPVLIAEKKTITEKHLELSSRSREENFKSNSVRGPADITWSSSGSDLSDEEKTVSQSLNDNQHCSTVDKFGSRKTLYSEDGAYEDKLQFIDCEVDSNSENDIEYHQFEEDESIVAISDSASCASSSSLNSEQKLLDHPKINSTEILEYSSDSGKEDDSENNLLIDSESPHKCNVNFGSDAKQVLEKLVEPCLKSTETILYTPQKQTNKFPRTPEDSAKKKKPIRGGLAERLRELQNRERSAISFWRHKCVSYQKAPKGRKSGVLTVKILELHEECTIQVAFCEQLEGLQGDSPFPDVATRPRTFLKVLFTKETAEYLKGRPQDIVHIYPPWQKLIIPNGNVPVVLNTYFCQKVTAKENSETTRVLYSPDMLLLRRNISLSQMFKFKDLTPKIQVTCDSMTTKGTDFTHEQEKEKEHFPAQTSPGDSFLDVVQRQGTTVGSRARVRVVVQRVYSLPCRDGISCAPCTHRNQPHTRVCLLVQDAYGLFGEVHIEGPTLKERELEGKSCSLVGVKVLQKAIRERTMGLFSLIDTIWLSRTPEKTSGQSQPCEEEQADLPAPSFCYILSAHPNLGQIDIIKEDPISKLYQPPVSQSLKEILQASGLSIRYTFYGRVIYQRPQFKGSLQMEQKEIWLIVTDVTLQEKNESYCDLPKTVPVCVASSCALDPEVLEALTVAAPHHMLFRDVLQNQGCIVCIEGSVLLLQKPSLCVASGVRAPDLTGPVRLDELSSRTQENSICTVQGTVTGVDESTAFAWPTCDRCGNGKLEQSTEHRQGAFYCSACAHVVTSPALRRHLQIYLNCPSWSGCSVKVKLLQSSISSLLQSATYQDESYEVKSVLGKEVGPLNCFVRSTASYPTSFVGLEEVQLLHEKEASASHPQLPRPL